MKRSNRSHIGSYLRERRRMVHASHEETTRDTAMEARPRDLDYPMSVRDAAQYLGVSAQTVYLWVERKQIPHLRVMGRNIRFLKSDLEAFRAQFHQEVGNGKTKEA